jgi:riboflavin synthase
MFTGIVTHLGRVAEWRSGRLGLEQPELAPTLEPGASVAVNGVCLTVTEVEGPTFFTDVVPETRRRTNLGALGPGDEVNLELPLTMQQGLDGHLVQGHVDGTTTVRAVREVDLGQEVTFELPPGLGGYIAEKGSVALDGTSLTVAGLDEGEGTFTVALIPHTLQHTVAHRYAPGRLVNVEVDVVARYVERLMRNGAPVAATSGAE